MTYHKKFIQFLLVVFAICGSVTFARAQDSSKAKPVEAHFEVLHMFVNSIQVRKVDNMREVHTFVYSDRIRSNMQERFSKGGYQYGDKVVIVYQPGAEIALRIRGRQSKSKPPKSN